MKEVRMTRSCALTPCLVMVVVGLTACTSGPNRRPLGVLHAEGNSALAAGDTETAILKYREYSQRAPGDADARYRLGKALLDAGEITAAREELAVAHRQRPDSLEFVETYARAILQADEPAAMYAVLQENARRRADDEGYLLLGRLSAEAGYVDEAARALRTAAVIGDPRDERAHRELARLYRQLGDNDREIERLRNVLYLMPSDGEASARLRELGLVPGPSLALPPSDLSNVDPLANEPLN